jgi:hypothetical protein
LLAALHYRLKAAYICALSVRLLGKLVSDGLVQNTYIMKSYDAEKGYDQTVILSIMLAAIFARCSAVAFCVS